MQSLAVVYLGPSGN